VRRFLGSRVHALDATKRERLIWEITEPQYIKERCGNPSSTRETVKYEIARFLMEIGRYRESHGLLHEILGKVAPHDPLHWRARDALALVKALALEQSSLYYVDGEGKIIDRFIPGYHNDAAIISSKRDNYLRAISIMGKLKKLEPVSELSIEQDVLTVYSSKFSFKIRLDIDDIDGGISKAFRVIKDLKNNSETARIVDASLPGNKVVVIGLRKI